MIDVVIQYIATAVIGMVSAIGGAYAAMKLMRNRGFFVNIIEDAVRRYYEDKVFHEAINRIIEETGTNLGRGLMNGLQIKGTKGRGGLIEQLIAQYLPRFLPQGKQEQQQQDWQFPSS